MTKNKFLQGLICFLLLTFGFFLGLIVSKPRTCITEQKKESEKKELTSEYETYTVSAGDTLYTIALKFGTTVEELCRLNNLPDPNQIKIGQVLKIRKSADFGSAGKIEIDMDKVKELQALVDKGEQIWRTDPVEVTKVEAPAEYEFTASDTYTLKSKDIIKGEAEVEVKKVKENQIRIYLVKLIQPVKKGEGGVFEIYSISEKK